MPVVRLRTQLRLRAAVRAGAAAAGAIAGLVALALFGVEAGGSAIGAVLVLLVALVGGLVLHRDDRQGLRDRLPAALELPEDAQPREQRFDRAIFGVYAAAMFVLCLAAGIILASAVWAALAVLAGTLAFTFADLLSARVIEVFEQARSVVVYSSRTAGAPRRVGVDRLPLYAERRTR